MSQLLKSVCLQPVLCNTRSHCNEKLVRSNKDPVQPKKEKIKKKNLIVKLGKDIVQESPAIITVTPGGDELG